MACAALLWRTFITATEYHAQYVTADINTDEPSVDKHSVTPPCVGRVFYAYPRFAGYHGRPHCSGQFRANIVQGWRLLGSRLGLAAFCFQLNVVRLCATASQRGLSFKNGIHHGWDCYVEVYTDA